jgi:hypothetical protein
MDIYVPETLLSDAMALLEEEAEDGYRGNISIA